VFGIKSASLADLIALLVALLRGAGYDALMVKKVYAINPAMTLPMKTMGRLRGLFNLGP